MRVVIEKEKNDIANVVVTYCFNRDDIEEINWIEFEKSKVLLEKGKDGKIYQNFLETTML